MFEDAASAQGILGYGYANLPFETKSTTDIATDDAVTNDLGSAYRSMAQGTWAANNDPMSQWQARRITIQYMNIFLQNVQNVQWSSDPKRQAMFVDKLRGEALALRALNMYYLLRNHAGWTSDGRLLGVPVILEPEGFDSDFNQPRATFQECVNQIYADVDEAMDLLPFDYVSLLMTAQFLRNIRNWESLMHRSTMLSSVTHSVAVSVAVSLRLSRLSQHFLLPAQLMLKVQR